MPLMVVDRRMEYFVRSAPERARDPIEFKRRYEKGERYLNWLFPARAVAATPAAGLPCNVIPFPTAALCRT